MYEANSSIPVLSSIFLTRKHSASILEKQCSSSWWISFSSRKKIRGARKAGPMLCVPIQASCKHGPGRKGKVQRLFTDVRTGNQKYSCLAGLIWIVTSCSPPSPGAHWMEEWRKIAQINPPPQGTRRACDKEPSLSLGSSRVCDTSF